ncbi:MAG: 23S rRNA (pseudouridine(1915)-N(3))-methyltransferase RlmH [Bacteroidales bacterium]|nr:23S rRNA (pseudouridine(1915)-N(3))-methyltransferase RlmH [Bacteroidales bacterium]
MNIKLLVVGKTVKGFISEGVEEYLKRLQHYVNFSLEVIPDIKNSSALSPLQLKEKEAEMIIKHISQEDNVILLDEHGKEFSSKDFASFLQQKMNLSLKSLVFVVGGAYGFDESIKQKFNSKISISKMTFSHQMIRLLFVEQVYRAFTILKNEPYHNE